MFLDMNRQQWTVLFAAWLGWGFDVFDGLLFNYVAPNCIPTLLGLKIGSPEAQSATLFWAGTLTSVLLLGWAIGGIAFGRLADKIGRTKTLLITMALYSLGTAACAFVPNIEMLVFCRIIASLGIGGEWAAGASMVAEVVPEHRRVEAGALLYTAAPMGLFLATFLSYWIQGHLFSGTPETSWRIVFLCGLIPAGVALLVRWFVKEPESWSKREPTSVSFFSLFEPTWRARTLSGLAMALIALLTWWSCNAFIPTIAKSLARLDAGDQPVTALVLEQWVAFSTNAFNLGGLIGTLLTVPFAKILGRRAMFGFYFFLASISIFGTFGLSLSPAMLLYGFFPIGFSVFGVFGSFTYYLPELFPTSLRATGSGFCYNAGRVIAALGPFLVGYVASQGTQALATATQILFYVGFIPLLGCLLIPFVVETKGQPLQG